MLERTLRPLACFLSVILRVPDKSPQGAPPGGPRRARLNGTLRLHLADHRACSGRFAGQTFTPGPKVAGTMSTQATPYIPATTHLPEITPRALAVGISLGLLMTAANAYLGLKVGITVSASIPAAVMSMLILRGLRFKDVNILENNAVQTMASSGESLAAGVIFTIPALLVMGVWSEIDWFHTLIIATLGGVLGTMFTITLRRVFIVEEALPYPEGVACREVLVAGEEGGSGLVAILYALGLGALYGWVVKGFQLTHEKVEGAIEVAGARLYGGAELSLALLAVGYIVGLRIASLIFLGGILGFGVLVPLFGMLHGWPVGMGAAEGFSVIWSEQVKYVGVGAMVVGGVSTLWSMRKTIGTGLRKALPGGDDDVLDADLPRTEQDAPMRIVGAVVLAMFTLTLLYYWWATGSFILALVGGAFLAVTAFFFSAVAGYIAGVVGSSNSPVSGMTIAALLFTALLVWVVGDLVLGMSRTELMFATLVIAAVVAVNAAIAGDVMQDLKTGHMVGATPKKQQMAEVVGVLTGAIAIGPTLMWLNKAYGISETHCERMLVAGDIASCDDALLAPQAELIGAIISGIFGGDLNVQMVLLGAAIAGLLIWKRLPVMSVAIGIYLPLYLSVPIVLGGILQTLIARSVHLRIDGALEGEPSTEAKQAADEVVQRGILLGAGLIAGESLMGVVIAVFIVAEVPPNTWFSGLHTLGPWLSLVFFAWFVSVFVYLASRGLPAQALRGGMLRDWLDVIRDAGRRAWQAVLPPPQHR